MKKTIFAIAAVLMTSGIALADDFTGNLQYGAQTPSRHVFNDRYGDAAPPSVVVNPGSVNFTGRASVANPGSPGHFPVNDRYGDAAPATVVVNPPKGGYNR